MPAIKRSCIFILIFAAAFAFASESPSVLQNLPMVFEANCGQAPAQYSYLLHCGEVRTFFSRNSVDFSLTGPRNTKSDLRLVLVGADTMPKATHALSAHSNYFFGSDASRWIRDVPLSSSVEYDGLAPGISLRFYGNGQEFEHDFQVDRGADVSQIAFRIEGDSSLGISVRGDLEIHTASGVLLRRKPVAYQDLPSGRVAVEAGFRIGNDGAIRFRLGKYDRTLRLVIDPLFVIASYLGGTGTDLAAAAQISRRPPIGSES
jgi:hypothetical protein